MPNRVVHFEIEAKDKERAKKFYKEAFDWKLEEMGNDFGGYIVVTTGDPKKPGGINGGIYQKMGKKKEVNAFRCVIGVDDIEKAIKDVKKAGGKVLNKPQDIPTVGLFVTCKDPEYNFFTLLQPYPDMTPAK